MKKRAWFCAAGLILLMGAVTGCQGKYQEVAVTDASAETDTTPAPTKEIKIETTTEAPAVEEVESGDWYTYEERTEQDGKIRSYLTGRMVDAAIGNRRPIAIMMSNDKQALPQYGINRAGVVYEAPVEGDMNRYMSIIEDYDDLERIGSVRSCRTYYTYFAREFDAIYAHYGQSTFAKPYLNNVDNINGLEGIGSVAYYRSSDRKAPHNAYTSGPRLQQSIEKLGYSQVFDTSYQGHYLFARDGVTDLLADRPGVMAADTVKPGYTMNKAYFQYDPEDGLYHRYQYGGVHQGNEGPITVKNVIFQCCQMGHYATTEYLNINVHAAECGFFITGGQAIPISWEKDGEFGTTHYYDLEHNEIVLNQGKTWVCIIPTRDFDKIEITGKE